MRDARDVVLLHGWGSGAAVWDELKRWLERRYRVHALPLPGYGPDAAPPADSMPAMVAAMTRLAPRRCSVVGWSLGGEVALAWARHAPRQVKRLALIATTPCFTRKPGWPCATAPEVLREFRQALAADRADTLARFAGAQGKGDARRGRFADVLQKLYQRDFPDAVLAAGLAVLAEADLRGELSRVRQPTLVLHGARDRIVPPAAGMRLAAALPDARFELMRSCAHAPFLSQPGRVARMLREFFG